MISIPHLADIVVDGSGVDWGDAGFQVNALSDDAPSPRSSDDFKVSFRLGWSEAGLLALISWQDDVADEASLAGGIYERDALELYLSPSPGSPNYFQVLISPGLSAAQPELRHFVYHYTRDAAWLKAASGLQVARQRHGRTATIEILMPWGAAGLDPTKQTPFAFRIFADDADATGDRWRQTWSSGEKDCHWLRCSDSASLPVNAAAPVPVKVEPAKLLRAAQTASAPLNVRRDFSRIDFERYVFAHDRFPSWSFLDPERTRAEIGDVRVSIRFFDEEGREVAVATRPGRYGAVLRVESGSSASFEIYRTLYRLPWTGGLAAEGIDEVRAIQLAEAAAGPLLAPIRNAYWWHALKKKLGVATTYKTLVQRPRGYDQSPERRWPVLLFLHGSGFGNETLLQAEAQTRYARESSDYPFILVQPMTAAAWEPAAIADVIDSVLRDERADPKRIYLAGFSLGGIGTWATALAMPDRFAAILPVGARGGEPALAARLADMPVWAWNGAEDPTTRPEQVQRMIDALTSVSRIKSDVRLTIVPGLTHPPTPDYVFGRPEIYSWFLARSRD